MAADDRSWNFADVWEAVADRFPAAPALASDGSEVPWRDFDERADGVAAALLAAGLGRQAKVAQYLYNGPEYLESVFACFKAGLVPVNTNYRYTGDELAYLWDNAEVEAVVFHSDLVDRCEELRRRTDRVRLWLWVDAGSGSCPSWATPYEEAAGSRPGRTVAPWGRLGDDLFLLYTGGTTGHPKGVMWQHDDFFRKPLSGGNPYGDPRKDLEEIGTAVKDFPSIAFLLAAPLMHGAASYSLFTFFTLGGRLVIQRDFDPEAIVTEVEKEKVNIVLIVGDAMGMPLVEELEKRKDSVDLSSMFSITSGGAIWSQHVRDRMLAVKPDLVLRDNFGASESGNDGEIMMDDNGNLKEPPTGRMMVVDESLNKIEPGSGDVGYIARIGNVPLGYYKDEEKTAKTFPTLPDGTRISILGDMGTVEADGSIVFLGRGSQCINTGGEKVYAEEVEATLHAHPAVADALVVPVPDEKYGQRVAAVISLAEGAEEPSLEEIQEHCRETLARYKVPRTVVFVDEVKRTPAGKADYRWAKAAAAKESAPV